MLKDTLGRHLNYLSVVPRWLVFVPILLVHQIRTFSRYLVPDAGHFIWFLIDICVALLPFYVLAFSIRAAMDRDKNTHANDDGSDVK